MSTAIEITLFIALVLSIILPGVAFLKGERTKGRFKSHLAVNCFTFFGLLGVTVVSTFAGASNVLAASASSGNGMATGLGYIAAALATGISCLGGVSPWRPPLPPRWVRSPKTSPSSVSP